MTFKMLYIEENKYSQKFINSAAAVVLVDDS